MKVQKKLLAYLFAGLISGLLLCAGAYEFQSQMQCRRHAFAMREFALLLAQSSGEGLPYIFPSRRSILEMREAQKFFSELNYSPKDRGALWDKHGRNFVAWGYQTETYTHRRAFIMTNLNVVFASESEVNWVEQEIRKNASDLAK